MFEDVCVKIETYKTSATKTYTLNGCTLAIPQIGCHGLKISDFDKSTQRFRRCHITQKQ
jgi:hypothetical protein